jgi:phospholipid/cholesterol/gamma-HCH transport system substrate-binding protein
MSRRVRAHPAAIGAFVAGAIALAIAGTLIFGASGKLFGRRFPVVMFFDDSVNGLAVGAPVAYRGIRLGQVTGIHSVVGSPRIAVAATLERGPFLTSESPTGTDQMRRAMEDAIAQGLRAQLAMQSLLTGQLYVSLVLRPDIPASFAGLDKRALEIPTIPTILAQLEAGLQKVPLVNMPKHLYDTLEGSARLLQSPDLARALDSVGPLVADAQTLLRRLDKDVGPLIASLRKTSDTAGAALTDMRPLIDTARASLVDITQRLDRVATELQADASRLMVSLTETSDTARGTVKDVGGDLQKTLAQLTPQIAALAAKLQEASDTLRRTLDTTHATIRDVDGALTGDSPLGHELARALKEVAAAAQSLRTLTDYLERHPESVLSGKPRPQSDR